MAQELSGATVWGSKRRAAGAIPVATTTPLMAFTVPWRIRPGPDSHSVVVKGTFDIIAGGAARLRPETDLPCGDVHLTESLESSLLYPSDFAVLKPRCDVVLAGHAYAPTPGATAAIVRFTFGTDANGFDRAMAAFGPRRWQGRLSKVPTAPEPFEAIPLVYERAFGGAGFADNPVGQPASAELLAQLEDPRQLVTSPSDRPSPMGFGAIPMCWRSRWGKLGTYGAQWLRTRFPYFPEDFDWAFFQSAPQAQQLDAIAGNERFVLVGMHARHARLEGQLPGCRPRCFVQRSSEAGGEFAEVGLRLDTVVFDVDELKLNLLWRGVVWTRDERASDVSELYVQLDDEAEPAQSLEQAQERYRALRAPLAAVPEVLGDGEAANSAGPALVPDPVELSSQRIRRLLSLPASGTAPVSAKPAAEPSKAAPSVSPPPAPARTPARPWTSPAAVAKHERALLLLQGGGPLDDCDLSEADLGHLDFSGRSLIGASFARSSLIRCRFEKANLRGAQLSGADLSDACLDEACLDLADLSYACLARASLQRTSLLQTDLRLADGPGARFDEARGDRPRFSQGNWTGARFVAAELAGADFTEAELSRASFMRALMRQIRLYGAQGSGVWFDEAHLEDARGDGAKLVRSSFLKLIADGAVFEGADFESSSFKGASLRGASFCEARCRNTVFEQADLSEARLGVALLAGAMCQRANLMKADLGAADLTGADLRDANLYGAELWNTVLVGALRDRALVAKTKLGAR